MKDWTPEEIRQFRKEHSLTRKALCKLLGLSSISSVFKWEHGARQPSSTTKLLLSRIEEELQRKGGE